MSNLTISYRIQGLPSAFHPVGKFARDVRRAELCKYGFRGPSPNSAFKPYVKTPRIKTEPEEPVIQAQGGSAASGQVVGSGGIGSGSETRAN